MDDFVVFEGKRYVYNEYIPSDDVVDEFPDPVKFRNDHRNKLYRGIDIVDFN